MMVERFFFLFLDPLGGHKLFSRTIGGGWEGSTDFFLNQLGVGSKL